MDSNNEEDQHASENEVDQSVPATPRRLSEVELQSPENTVNSGSFVWKHFTKDSNYKSNKKAHCNYCKKTYICSAGSTTGPSKHLQKNHSIKLGHQNAQQSVVDMLNKAKVNI
jgi:hypothetical protein